MSKYDSSGAALKYYKVVCDEVKIKRVFPLYKSESAIKC